MVLYRYILMVVVMGVVKHFAALMHPMLLKEALQDPFVLLWICPHVSHVLRVRPKPPLARNPLLLPNLIHVLNDIHCADQVPFGVQKQGRGLQRILVENFVGHFIIFGSNGVKHLHVEVNVGLEELLGDAVLPKDGFRDPDRNAIDIHDRVPDLGFHGRNHFGPFRVGVEVVKHPGKNISSNAEPMNELLLVSSTQEDWQKLFLNDWFDQLRE